MSLELSRNFTMYYFYMALKYALHWIVITFIESGSMVHANVSSIFHTIAMYDGTPYFCNFCIYLYDTNYAAGSVMDIRHVS